MNLRELTKGIWAENPIFVIMLGCCPALAVSTSLANAFGMGIAATFVLLGSNLIISLIRASVPDKIRIPVYIVVIATFVTMIDKFMAAFTPALSASLGIFIPLIVVNCIILGRAEAFANKNTPQDSILDAIGMGLGFTLALAMIAFFREVLGDGKFFGIPVPVLKDDPCLLMIMAPGGFFVFGLLMAWKKHMAAGGAK
ncbi:MAG: Electron transport complex protein RnfE [Candidatus Ozemobacter sibiricus]|jgi:electron transport complex protein RnfE|uniref:Ion-translocating oxidoreductase complex subunit E n=1 Tax=Candidatus Ozemobacter sibiricus TaxID=2268124 RepID=A0A367ZIA5_9BACT|nr:MAG: Electron transport complex protein RnfE [Candidatus Ozemobacter sibiricus]